MQEIFYNKSGKRLEANIPTLCIVKLRKSEFVRRRRPLNIKLATKAIMKARTAR